MKHRLNSLARSLCLATALVASMVPVRSFADTTCARSTDEKSVFIRALQTQLMVSALTCSSSDQYNTFIQKFQPVLIQNSKQLQSFFKKLHGKAGPEELNAFVTHLANGESQRSIQMGQLSYCDNASKVFQAVSTMDGTQLADYSTTLPIIADAPVHACSTAPAAATPAKTKN